MLHILYGPDSFSRREALQRLKAELDTDGMLENSTAVYEAREVTPQEVIAACDSLPFLSLHRLVILQGLLQQSAGGAPARRSRRSVPPRSDGLGPWQTLVDYVDRMPPTTTLVVLDGAAPSGPLLEALAAKGRVRQFRPPEQGGVPGWINARARAMGLQMEGRAVALLADLVGPDLWTLSSELSKLAAYAAGRPVKGEDVLALVSAARELEVWGLLDAVVEGRPAEALKVLRRLLGQGRNSAQLLATIQSRYRRLAIARDMLDAGAHPREIGERLGITKQFALEKLLEEARRHPPSRLRAAYQRLLEADAGIKRGVYDEETALELLVHDLASRRAATGAA